MGKAGADVAVSASLAGQYVVVVDLEESGAVTLSVERSRKADASLALELGVDIGIEGLAEQDFVPDAAVCAADVPAGRPAPWMIYRAMELLGVYPPQAVVAIGDTIADIEAGLNAGVWAMGVTRTGNMLGLAQEDVAACAALCRRLDVELVVHPAGSADPPGAPAMVVAPGGGSAASNQAD